MMRIVLVWSVMVMCGILSHGGVAEAQNPSDKSALAVSPAIVEHVLQPEKTKSYTLRVTNLTSFPLPISGTVKNFVTLEDVSDPRKATLYDASRWFEIKEPDFILQPKQTREVTITITPPKDSEPGGHYATVYFQPLLPAGALTPATAYLTARVGSLAFLIVPGAFEEKLMAKELNAPGIVQSSPVSLDLKLRNDGNIHQSPNAKIVLRNMFGTKVGEITTKPGIILPGTEKTYTAIWNKSLSFGRYNATAEVSYGSESRKAVPIAATFWVIPWTAIIIGLLFIGAVFIGVRTKGRWKKAWRILRGRA